VSSTAYIIVSKTLTLASFARRICPVKINIAYLPMVPVKIPEYGYGVMEEFSGQDMDTYASSARTETHLGNMQNETTRLDEDHSKTLKMDHIPCQTNLFSRVMNDGLPSGST